ncbi:hypothetical protein B0T20DRAFT_345940 [Sordaria brevicollis]|uniref:Uncharacterized protein n=1 Tax=Sordaria brevicollis TaxID=83679 RepID=A0AAE0PKW0_SORBR|nr:hypothetical protein B0T20DRAFT_345940 [Sordaria brevicollis]
MAAVAPANLPQREGRRPSYQYYNNKQSGLLPEVPLLTGTDNFRVWEVAVLAHLRHYELASNSEGHDPSTPRSVRDGPINLSWDQMQNRMKVYTIIRRSIAGVLTFLEQECRSNPWISLNDPTYDAKGLYMLVKEVYTRLAPLNPHPSQNNLMIDLLMLKAVNFGSLSEYLDKFYALWSKIDMEGVQLTEDVLLSFLVSGLNGHYDSTWTEDLEIQRLKKKIDLHEALKLVGERVCEEQMAVLPPAPPPKDAKYRSKRSSNQSSSSSTTEQGMDANITMDESTRGPFGHDDSFNAEITRRQEEMSTHFDNRTLQWAVESAFATDWSLDDLDPVSSEYDMCNTSTDNAASDNGSRSASPADKRERRRGYQRLSDLVARYTPLPLSVTSGSPSTIEGQMEALHIDKSRPAASKPRYVPSPPPTDEAAAGKERRRNFLTRFVGTPIKSSPIPSRVVSYQEGWKPKPLFSSPRKFSWEDGVSNSEHDYESIHRTTPEPHARRPLPPTPGTGITEKQQQAGDDERDEHRPRKRLSSLVPQNVAKKTTTAVRNFSRPERPLIRTASL